MAENKGFIFYNDYWQHLQLLSDAERGLLLTAVYAYKGACDMPELVGAAKMAFSFIRAQMDRDCQKYESKCERNRQNGAKGGRPPKDIKSDDNPQEPKISERLFEKPKKPYTDTNTETDTNTDKGTDNKIVMGAKTALTTKTTKFTRPTVDEVTSYCQERQNNIDPQQFIDYYAANGWRVGKNSMKDWKAAVRTWERNDIQRQPPTQQYQAPRKETQNERNNRLLDNFFGSDEPNDRARLETSIEYNIDEL